MEQIIISVSHNQFQALPWYAKINQSVVIVLEIIQIQIS